MPRVIRPEELDALANAIGQCHDGADIDDIAAMLEPAPARRTLQRRLATLVAQQRLTGQREYKSFRYRLAPPTQGWSVEESIDPRPPRADAYVPISAQAAEVKAYVRRPVQGRRPVGYNIEFLTCYRPNVTWYLPDRVRRDLHSLGRSPATHAPAGTFARDILYRLLIDLSWASSRLEGNTYSRLDTERLIRYGEAAAGKDAIETQMILNHKMAIEYLVHDAERVGINPETVIAIHSFLSDSLLADPMACGRLRQITVGIGGSVYRPIASPPRLAELFATVLGLANAISDPFEQAFFLMVHLPYLQPFEDVNKRVSRLAANVPLVKANLCPLSFIDVPAQSYVDALLGVYELNRVDLLRDVFVWAYERSCQEYVAVQRQLVPPDPFRMRFRRALSEAVRAIIVAGMPATLASARQATPRDVPADARERFAVLVVTEFESIHAGNAVRFGVRPLEWQAWQQTWKPTSADA